MVARVTAEYAGLEGDWKGLEKGSYHWILIGSFIESFWILAAVQSWIIQW